ncbi:MAG: HNH endonuclease [Candidatus Weimeria sp.]
MVYKYIYDTERLKQIIERFHEFVMSQPGQENKKVSFTSGYLSDMKNEGYKPAVYVKATDLLNIKSWNKKRINSGESAALAIRAMNLQENNFVYHQQKTLFSDMMKTNPVEGALILYDFYCDKSSEEDSLEKMASFFGRRYDIISYLFYLKDPDNYFPCKPKLFKDGFGLLGMETKFFSSCTYENYSGFCNALKQLATFYSSCEDHISALDAHSFVWVISRYKEVRKFIFEEDPTDKDSDSNDSGSKKEHLALVKTRVNQTEFRMRLIDYWNGQCAVTGCEKTDLLIASHIKPWRDCTTNKESISKYNGLLLTPNLDALFDAGYITFRNDGSIVISPQLSRADKKILGITDEMKLKKIAEGHREFLEYHRNNIYRK